MAKQFVRFHVMLGLVVSGSCMLLVGGCDRGETDQIKAPPVSAGYLEAVPDVLVGDVVHIKRMKFESATFGKVQDVIETTGARFIVDKTDGSIMIEQQLGVNRMLAIVRLEKRANNNTLADPIFNGFECSWNILHDEGQAVIISGDSTVRVLNTTNLSVQYKFQPVYTNVYTRNNGVLWLDDEGGICVVPPLTENSWPVHLDEQGWRLSAEKRVPEVFVGVCPPREFDWQRSFENVVHYSSHVQRYPSDEQIEEFSRWASVLQLHSWIWKDRYDETKPDDTGRQPPPLWWDYSWLAPDYRWIADNDDELQRVVATAHRHGMKVIPYVNFYLLHTTGERKNNYHLQLAELRKIYEKYGFDGFYLDGLYVFEPEPSYTIMRTIRQMVGDEGWLTLHNTGTSFPFIDAYADLIITSEHASFDRWASTSYKISNATASLWPELPIELEDGRDVLRKLVDESLEYNNRVIFMVGKQGQWRLWRLYHTENEVEFMKQYYLAKTKEFKENRSFEER